MMQRGAIAMWLVVVGILTSSAGAQNLAPPLGEWTPVGPEGQLFRPAPDRVGVRGEGENSVYWRSPELTLKPGGAYVFRFRAAGSGSGLIISGPEGVNHDFLPPGDETTFQFAFRVPDGEGKHALRMGQWELRGELTFLQPELYPVRVLHRPDGATSLGTGETLEAGHYSDVHVLGWRGTTIHRTLYSQRAGFNSHRWTFGPGSEVVYRHEVGVKLESGTIDLNVNYHTAGTLEVAASRDGAAWEPVAIASDLGTLAASLPGKLFPADVIYVRLTGGSAPTNLQVDAYRFEATNQASGPPRTGGTWMIEEPVCTGEVRPLWRPGSGVYVPMTDDFEKDHDLRVTYEIDGKDTKTFAARIERSKPVSPDGRFLGPLPPLAAGPHTIVVKLEEGEKTVYLGRMDVTLGPLEESGYGAPLGCSRPGDLVSLWWCEGARKVARDTAPPRLLPGASLPGPVLIEAARNEYEPAQLVIRTGDEDTALLEATVSDLRSGEHVLRSSEVSLFEVATVRVVHPSDAAGGPGEYPDPLPPLELPLRLSAERNQVLWVLAHVPEGTPAGDYDGTIRLVTSEGKADVPLRVHVFDFTLPKTTYLRGGFGLNAGNIRRYHKLTSDSQLREVYALYLKSFAEHRIMPYSFFDLDPIRLGWEGEGAARRPVVDFSAFDAAARKAIDGLGFNSFRLPLAGLGGGTFHARQPGVFDGHEVGSDEYERLMGDYLGQIESHLAEKGWLDDAYVYWFDEPDPKDYPFVVDVMKRLKRHAPGLQRMLTEQPEPELLDHVEIWCGLTPAWSPESVQERRAAGQEVWWYICTGPKAPYIGLFIEHPALEMRLWPWQTWQYGVEGLLIWETSYWTSSTAFPDSLQDPWDDPMSYTSGYGVPKGTKRHWGNGDGRFYYPPRRDPNQDGPPVIAPPIDCIRWENLRDGIEDTEYLVLLQELSRRKIPTAVLKPMVDELLGVPTEISRDLTHFTTDPRKLLDRRRRIALAVEALVRQ